MAIRREAFNAVRQFSLNELARMAGNSVLETYLNDIIRRTPLVILAHLGDDEDNRCRNHEHEAIVDAIARRDVRRHAVAVMNQHLLQIESKIQAQTGTAARPTWPACCALKAAGIT